MVADLNIPDCKAKSCSGPQEATFLRVVGSSDLVELWPTSHVLRLNSGLGVLRDPMGALSENSPIYFRYRTLVHYPCVP